MLTYKWYRGDTLILSATSTSYTTQAADVGQSITCQITGTNASGSFTAISSPITPTGPPNNSVQPVVTGGIAVGYVATSTSGSWTGYPTPTLYYQWYRGDTLIAENTTSYTIQASDVGQSITCHVTATNAYGSATAISSPITPTGPPVINNNDTHQISGNALVGSTLTITNGTWNGYPAPMLTYKWYRGDTLILSATSTSYTTQAADVGQSITCQITGTNASGSFTAISSPITPTGPPNNSVQPVISGIASVGSTLTITNAGTWTGYPTPTLYYQWYRGDTLIQSATNTGYIIQASDVGQSITCHVTGTNTSGSFTAIITPITPTGPPVNTNNDTPQISGNALVGSTLTLSNPGTWTGYPAPTLTYQWYRGAVAIPSATNNTYVIQVADSGQSITCHVTGTNAIGFATAISNSITPTGPPNNSVQPVISGIASVGSTLTTTNGSWTGYPAPTLTYKWYRGDTLIAENTTSYTIQASDVGQSITYQVTGTNASGSATAISSPIGLSGPPVNTNNDIPQISGISPYSVGSILTLTHAGRWNGYPTPTLTYQWYRGDTPLSGKTSTSYTTQAADVGQPITCHVTATNAIGSAIAISISIIPTSPPSNSVRPVVTGGIAVGYVATSTSGSWTGYPAPTLTYKWYRGSTLIAENTTSYTIQASDVAQPITCQVTATNTSGSATAISKPITPGIPPGINNNNDTPQISGISPYSVGSTLTITNAGTWTGYPTPTLTYQWYRGNNPLSSEISTRYTIVTADVGQSITCQVTATNTSGSANAISSPITPSGPPGINNNDTPQISGNALIGSTLTLTNAGTWNGYPTPTLTYQWYRGDTPIYGQNNTTYVTVNAIDIEQLITCRVTGTNTSGSFTAISNSISPYIQTTQCNQQ
jgi:hypothetical protein